MGTGTRGTRAADWLARVDDLLRTDSRVPDCGRLTPGEPVFVCGVVGFEEDGSVPTAFARNPRSCAERCEASAQGLERQECHEAA